MVLENFLKGHAYYGHWIKRTSNKLLLGAQGFCPLKYTNCGNKFLNFYFFGFLLWTNFLPLDTLGTKSHKKHYHVDILEVVVL
jgi:hypothetical protein